MTPTSLPLSASRIEALVYALATAYGIKSDTIFEDLQSANLFPHETDTVITSEVGVKLRKEILACLSKRSS